MTVWAGTHKGGRGTGLQPAENPRTTPQGTAGAGRCSLKSIFRKEASSGLTQVLLRGGRAGTASIPTGQAAFPKSGRTVSPAPCVLLAPGPGGASPPLESGRALATAQAMPHGVEAPPRALQGRPLLDRQTLAHVRVDDQQRILQLPVEPPCRCHVHRDEATLLTADL